MGEAAFSSAMRELYEQHLDYRYYPTDEEVYRVFLKHTPQDREDALLDVYRRLHGGPFIDGNRRGNAAALEGHSPFGASPAHTDGWVA